MVPVYVFLVSWWWLFFTVVAVCVCAFERDKIKFLFKTKGINFNLKRKQAIDSSFHLILENSAYFMGLKDEFIYILANESNKK